MALTLLSAVTSTTTGTGQLVAASPIESITLSISATGNFTAQVSIETSPDNITYTQVKLWDVSGTNAFTDSFAYNIPANNYVRARVVSITGTSTTINSTAVLSAYSTPAANFQIDASGNVTGLVGPDGKQFQLTRYGSRLAMFGDSRFASGYPIFTPSALSLSGSTASITATGIGGRFVGEEINIGRSNGIDYMRATIATIVDANNITATVTYPSSGLPSGSIVTPGSTVNVRDSKPSMCSSYATWILALLGQPFETVKYYGYSGCRIEGGIEYQIKDALAVGFDAAWIHLSANNYLTTLDNQDASVITPKLDQMIDMLQGKPVWFFLEPPLSGSYYSDTHKARILAINAWASSKPNVRVVDLYTPMDDGTGTAKIGYLYDGLHPGIKGALNASLSVYQSMNIKPITRFVTALDAGGARFPLANPTMSGTLGANLPTGYTKGVSGSVTESSYTLSAKADGSGNEFSAVVVATGAGSHYIRSASTAVTAGGKYRCRCKLTVTDGVGVDYPEITLRNQTGDTLIQNVLYATNVSGSGSADGTYTIWAELDVVIPAAVTNVYLRPRIFFDGAGGATITYSDFQLERIS